MSADFASATINNVATAAVPGNRAVQPPIGYNTLTAANTGMWNGDIGRAWADRGYTAAENMTVNLQGTPGLDNVGGLMTHCLCVAGCTNGQNGTITAGAFVVGAGTSQARATIPAGGYGWVRN